MAPCVRFTRDVLSVVRSSFPLCVVLIHVQDLPLAFEWLKIDHTFPKSFPINTINMMRALRAIQDIAPEKLEKATDAFYVRCARFPPSDL